MKTLVALLLADLVLGAAASPTLSEVYPILHDRTIAAEAIWRFDFDKLGLLVRENGG